MNWKAQKTKGQTPANIEVVWKKENRFFVMVATSVCPTFPGDMIEPRRAEIATLIEFAPKMRELLQDIASPRRGSKAEKWDIQKASEVAAILLEEMKAAELKF